MNCARRHSTMSHGAAIVPPPPAPAHDDYARAYAGIGRSFISDTITLPTPRMREAMASAVCGEDVYHVRPARHTR